MDTTTDFEHIQRKDLMRDALAACRDDANKSVALFFFRCANFCYGIGRTQFRRGKAYFESAEKICRLSSNVRDHLADFSNIMQNNIEEFLNTGTTNSFEQLHRLSM